MNDTGTGAIAGCLSIGAGVLIGAAFDHAGIGFLLGLALAVWIYDKK